MTRGKYQGIILFAITIGNAIGPVVGGILAEGFNWRVSPVRMP